MKRRPIETWKILPITGGLTVPWVDAWSTHLIDRRRTLATWAAAPRARALVVCHILLACGLWPLRRLYGRTDALWLHALMRAYALALAEGQLGEHHPIAVAAWTAISQLIGAAKGALGAPLARLEARLIGLGRRIDRIMREVT